MNVKDNMRKKESCKRIEKTFVNLLQSKDIHKISVSELCFKAEVNRSTFYANYLDIYDLADKIKETLIKDLGAIKIEKALNNNDADSTLMFFRHIKENQLLYKTYFKLGFDATIKIESYNNDLAEAFFQNKYMSYHITFFMFGLNAIIKKWLDSGCKETPEEMTVILRSEYQGRM